jgi:hypothetical protein
MTDGPASLGEPTTSHLAEQLDLLKNLPARVSALELAFMRHDEFEKHWRDEVLVELRANTEITRQIRDAKTFARIGAWIFSGAVGLLLSSIALLAAIKSMFVGGDQPVVEWLRSLWRGE